MQDLVGDAVPLLGMSLLRGSELRVEAKPGGKVVVSPLPKFLLPGERNREPIYLVYVVTAKQTTKI